MSTTETPKVVWEDPPAHDRHQGRRTNPLVGLMGDVIENPGKWARITVGNKSTVQSHAQALRTKNREEKLPGQKEGEWEIITRKMEGENMSGLWVMYKPKPS